MGTNALECKQLVDYLRHGMSGVLMLLAASGCEAPLPETPPPPAGSTVSPAPAVVAPGEAFEAWKAIAEAPPEERDIERAFTLTGAMAAPEDSLAPLIDFVGNDATPGEQRVFAVMCLSSQRDALRPFEEQIAGWVAPSKPVETRKLGAHVLGLIRTPTAMETMERLLEDESRPVREAAMGVLLTYHPEMVTGSLMDFWNDPETSPAIRDQVVLGMPPHLVASYLPIYAAAAADHRLAEPARLRAISVLGELGETAHIEVLEACMEHAPEETVKAHARGALALLRATAGPETTAVTE